MRAVASAVSLAKDIDSEVRLIWNIDRDVGCSTSDLFEFISGVKIVRNYNRSGFRHHIRKRLGLRNRNTVLTTSVIREMINCGFDFQILKSIDSPYFWTFDAFYPVATPLTMFTPHRFILNIVENITSTFQNTIGVHIRRTDNHGAIERSPIYLFTRQMQNAIDDDQSVNFFLATDDPAVEEQITESFPGRIITRPKTTLRRDCAQGIQDALIDVYCLSATSRILGCDHSSFSPIAAAIGNIPIDILSLAPGFDEKVPYRT